MPLPRKKILVVEDDLVDLMSATLTIAQGGQYDIVSAERGDQAVMLARKLTNLALVIMDIRLPGFGRIDAGIEAIERIREFAPTLPILAITAWGERLRGAAMAAGANAFLRKDAGTHEILRVVENLLGSGKGK